MSAIGTESVELLRDIDARWEVLRATRDSLSFDKNKDEKLFRVVNAPNADIYVVEVSFQGLTDKFERDYLNQLPTSFVLPSDAVDRLRAAARKVILASPEFQQFLSDTATRKGRP